VSHPKANRSGAALLAAVLALLAGCGGWRAGLSPDLPPDATLGVHWLGNDSRVRDLELDMTRALVDAALDRVPLRPDHPARADYVLRGVLQDYRRRPGIRSPGNVQEETGVEILLAVELVRGSSGRVVARSERRLAAGFALDERGLSIASPTERAQRERVIRNLAEGVILDLFGPAAYKEDGEASD
jgi:hypothetical protein